MRKIPCFYLNSWCGNFVERHSFSIVLRQRTEKLWTMSKHVNGEKTVHHEACFLVTHLGRTLNIHALLKNLDQYLQKILGEHLYNMMRF